MKADFFSMAMKHFQYLVAEYGFTINKVQYSERAPIIEGRIEFQSANTFVTVSSDRGAVNTFVGRTKDDKYNFFLDPQTIYEYLTLTEADKRLVCSFDPKDDRKARIVIHQMRLLHNKKDSNSIVEDIDSQLADDSTWLRQYAEPFLRGDFSLWLEIYEFTVNRQRAQHARSRKEEFVRTVGHNRHQRTSIFQSRLNYLEKLREEYGKR